MGDICALPGRQFQRGDITVTASGSAACYCILEVERGDKNTYVGLNLVNRKHYRIAEKILLKVGTATAEFLEGQTRPPDGIRGPEFDLDYRRGQARAEREAWRAPESSRKRWEMLAAAKPGDAIKIQHGCGHIEELTFYYVLERGTKFVFVAKTRQGSLHKFALDELYVSEGPTSAEDILRMASCVEKEHNCG